MHAFLNSRAPQSRNRPTNTYPLHYYKALRIMFRDFWTYLISNLNLVKWPYLNKHFNSKRLNGISCTIHLLGFCLSTITVITMATGPGQLPDAIIIQYRKHKRTAYEHKFEQTSPSTLSRIHKVL